jgi:transposase InsO family protein
MARRQRQPTPGTVVHADRGSQYTSWLFGRRLRQAGLVGSMGRVASSVDNGLMESFWSTTQRELLERHEWASRAEPGSAIFQWIEGFYDPRRRHSGFGYLSAIDFEKTAQHRRIRGKITNNNNPVRKSASSSTSPSASRFVNRPGVSGDSRL